MITTLFLDIGGVLLNNGWDREARKLAAAHFDLDINEMEERHHLTFDTYEVGKITMDEYLKRLIFYEKRDFMPIEFLDYMLKQSKPFPDMVRLVALLKQKYHLKVAVLSNEGRELTVFRIHKFHLNDFVDFFIVSSFVHIRKPDTEIYQMALDISQVCCEEVVYIEDRTMFVKVAEELGIHGIRHEDYNLTKSKLSEFGLNTDEG